MAQFTAVLQCLECHVATASFERGWRAFLVPADEGPTEELVVLCPECWEREFGGWREERNG